MNLVVDKIVVDNLKCHGCANTIRTELMKLTGIVDVKSNPDEGWVEVEHEDLVDKQIILEKLGDLGYPEVGTTNLFQTAKSYVSCAVGRFGSKN